MKLLLFSLFAGGLLVSADGLTTVGISLSMTTAPHAAVGASKGIRWLHVNSSGVNPAPHVSAVAEKGGTITSSTGANSDPVSQTAFTGLLMLARGFTTHVRNQAKREWRKLRDADVPDLRGQTLVTIGFGAVGSKFATYARAFGLKVVALRRSPMKPGDPADEMYPPSKLTEVLPRADWLMLTCPLTPETRNLINADTIRLMKAYTARVPVNSTARA